MDTTSLMNRGRDLAASMIKTAGTRVQFIDRDITTSTGSLEQEVTEGLLYAGPAILVSASNQMGVIEFLPGVSIKGGVWTLTMLPTLPDIEPGTVVRVEKCRDRVLVGAEGKVVGVVRDSAAAVARVYVEPRRLG